MSQQFCAASPQFRTLNTKARLQVVVCAATQQLGIESFSPQIKDYACYIVALYMRNKSVEHCIAESVLILTFDQPMLEYPHCLSHRSQTDRSQIHLCSTGWTCFASCCLGCQQMAPSQQRWPSCSMSGTAPTHPWSSPGVAARPWSTPSSGECIIEIIMHSASVHCSDVFINLTVYRSIS